MRGRRRRGDAVSRVVFFCSQNARAPATCSHNLRPPRIRRSRFWLCHNAQDSPTVAARLSLAAGFEHLDAVSRSDSFAACSAAAASLMFTALTLKPGLVSTLGCSFGAACGGRERGMPTSHLLACELLDGSRDTAHKPARWLVTDAPASPFCLWSVARGRWVMMSASSVVGRRLAAQPGRQLALQRAGAAHRKLLDAYNTSKASARRASAASTMMGWCDPPWLLTFPPPQRTRTHERHTTLCAHNPARARACRKVEPRKSRTCRQVRAHVGVSEKRKRESFLFLFSLNASAKPSLSLDTHNTRARRSFCARDHGGMCSQRPR